MQLPVTTGKQLFIDVSYEYNVDTLASSAKFPCSPEMDRRFDECMDSRVPENLLEEFGCTVPYLPVPEGQTICDLTHNRTVVFNR